MTMFPWSLANGAGQYVDHTRYMDNWLWVFAMMKGNFVANGGFENWSAATSFSNPANGATLSDGWILEKAGTTPATANFSRSSAQVDTGDFSALASLTVAGSSDSTLKLKQVFGGFASMAGLTVYFAARVKTNTGSKVRISVTDGVTLVRSAFHSGSGGWETLGVALTCDDALSELTVRVEITSDFDTDPVYVDSSFLYIIDPSMSQTARDALLFFSPDQRTNLATNTLDLVGLTSAPTAVAGRIYFNSVDGQFYGCKDGTTWSILG